jgi:signal transduction histidine kinase
MAEFLREPRRYLAGGSVSLLGLCLVAIPVFDIWDDTANLDWSLMLTLAENITFLALSGILIGGGIWLVRSDWETEKIEKIGFRTAVSTCIIGLLIGWAAFAQLLTMPTLKPYILALDGVLVGAVASFGFSVSAVRAGTFKDEAEQERSMNERLTLLYRAASDLESAPTHEEAYDIVEAAIDEAITDAAFHVVVDNEVVVDHGHADTTDRESKTTVDIGDRGKIELLDESLDSHEILTVELFASHLAETIQRIEREERLRDERNIFAFINRTLRHDIMGDLSLVKARLKMVDRNDAVSDDQHAEHLRVALDRTEEMEEFVQTMRTYMKSVVSDEHSLEAVDLRPLVDEHVTPLRDAYRDAEVVNEGVPDVAVAADDLLDRVFENLLRNAIEHNDAPTPRVVVEGERGDGVATIRVADNGPGISEHRRKSIFEQGERGTESDGTGFGLYLVKDVVESYDGDIRVRDNEPRGTVFELDLPLASTLD